MKLGSLSLQTPSSRPCVCEALTCGTCECIIALPKRINKREAKTPNAVAHKRFNLCPYATLYVYAHARMSIYTYVHIDIYIQCKCQSKCEHQYEYTYVIYVYAHANLVKGDLSPDQQLASGCYCPSSRNYGFTDHCYIVLGKSVLIGSGAVSKTNSGSTSHFSAISLPVL